MSHRVAFLDLDQTLYNGFSLLDVARDQQERGIITEEDRLVLDGLLQEYKQGSRSYPDTTRLMVNRHAAMLKDVDYDVPFGAAKEYFANNRAKFFPFAHDMVRLLGEHHYESYLVTAEPDYIAEAAMEELGAHSYVSSDYAVEIGRYTGRAEQILATSEEKAEAVRNAMFDFDAETAFAFGDSESDVAMLGLVRHAVCINPSGALRGVALERGWHITTAETVIPAVMNLLEAQAKTQGL